MGRAVKITRRDFTALELRAASAKCTDGARSTSFLGQALELDDAYQTRVVACDARIEAALRRRRDTAARPVGRLPPARHRDGTANAPTFDARAALHAVLGVDLTQIHGLGPSLALKLVGECGTDLSAWPNAKHFTSWLCLTPSNKISGGKVLSTRTRRSGGRAAALLRLAAVCPTVGRTQTAPGAFYRRLSARVGKAKAVTATARRIAALFYTRCATGWPTQTLEPHITRNDTGSASWPTFNDARSQPATCCKRRQRQGSFSGTSAMWCAPRSRATRPQPQ